MESATINRNKLCMMALTDAIHDFDIKKIPYARKALPGKMTCPHYSNEDTFLDEVVGLQRDAGYYSIKDLHPLNDIYEEKMIDNGELYSVLMDYGISELYLVVDTYIEALVPELRVEQNDIQYYWVQNKQTLYDPAKKTTESTQAGMRPATHKKGAGIFRNNKNVFFCWEDTTRGSQMDIYPRWNINSDANILIRDIPDKNMMYFSGYDICQIINSETNYEKQEAKCIIKTPDNRIIIITKTMAQRKAPIISKLSKVTVKTNRAVTTGLGNLNKFITHISGIESYTDIYHTIAKRLGDQGQALSCLNDSFKLFVNNTRVGRVTQHTSNGYHCFVTYDRPALGAALLYGAPIILYCYQKTGDFHLFVRRDLLAPELLLEKMKIRYLDLYASMIELFKEYSGKMRDFYEIKSVMKKTIDAILNSAITSVRDYQMFIAELMKLMKLFLLFAQHENIVLEDINKIPDNITGYGLDKYKEAVAAIDTLTTQIDMIKRGMFAVDSKEEDIEIGVLLPGAKENISRTFMDIDRVRVTPRMFETYHERVTGGSYIRLIYEILLTDFPAYALRFKERIYEWIGGILVSEGADEEKANIYQQLRTYVENQFAGGEKKPVEPSAGSKRPRNQRGGTQVPQAAKNNIWNAETLSYESAKTLIDYDGDPWSDAYCRMALALYIVAKSIDIKVMNVGIGNLMNGLYKHLMDMEVRDISLKSLQKQVSDYMNEVDGTDFIDTQMEMFPELWKIYNKITMDDGAKEITFPDLTIIYEYLRNNKISFKSATSIKSKTRRNKTTAVRETQAQQTQAQQTQAQQTQAQQTQAQQAKSKSLSKKSRSKRSSRKSRGLLSSESHLQISVGSAQTELV
jgi:hypothetical protein